MNFPLSVSPSKEMGDRTRQRKKSPTSPGIEPTISGFDRSLLYRLSHEARRKHVVGDCGGNDSNVNMKGTNECYTVSTKDTNDRLKNYIHYRVHYLIYHKFTTRPFDLARVGWFDVSSNIQHSQSILVQYTSLQAQNSKRN